MIKNYHKLVILSLLIAGYSGTVLGDCEYISNYYTQCNPGYYLLDSVHDCRACPSVTDIFYANNSSVTPTSPDENTSGITSCYIAAGTYKDQTGYFTITDDCNYDNTPTRPTPPGPPQEDE